MIDNDILLGGVGKLKKMEADAAQWASLTQTHPPKERHIFLELRGGICTPLGSQSSNALGLRSPQLTMRCRL